MQIDFRITNADIADVLHGYVERRLRFAVGRFGDRVGMVSVRLYGGDATQRRCRMEAELHPFGRVSAEERAPDLLAAIDGAAGRLARGVARELGRLRDLQMQRDSIRLVA